VNGGRSLYRHILVPTDGSRRAEAAAETAIGLSRALGARLTVVHVVASRPRSRLEAWAHNDAQYGERFVNALERRAVLFLQTIRENALRAGVSCECRVVSGAMPHEGIVQTAVDYDCDLIVMASHRLAEKRGMLDAETIKVLAEGHVPVLVWQ
jgi:nucleotide-binding universal stress UspA family protein